MASFFDKIRIKTAERSIEKFDLSSQHFTSQNFNNNQPIYHRELIPKSSIKVDANSFARFEPMPVPTFSQVDVINRAFFVPYRTVFRPFDDFINNVAHQGDAVTPYIVEEVPFFTPQHFFNFFLSDDHAKVGNLLNLNIDYFEDGQAVELNNNFVFGLPEHLVTDPNSSLYAVEIQRPVSLPSLGDYRWRYNQLYYSIRPDLVILQPTNSGDEPSMFLLTAAGRARLKIMESLGYRFDWSQFNRSSPYCKRHISALPLLCYSKIVHDWFVPSSYVKAVELYNTIESLYKYDVTFDISPYLEDILDFCNQYILSADYFTSALDNAETPAFNSQSINFIRFSDQSTHNLTDASYITGSAVSNGVSNAQAQEYNSQTDTPVDAGASTSWAITAVQRLQQYLKRNQLAGAKVIDRFLARYGVALPSERSDRAQFLGESSYSASFSDVMQTTNSDGSLGDFAGKGVAAGHSTFDYQASEFGLFIIVNCVQPRITYTQGCDRFIYHTKMLDFYTPEFDNMGAQSVLKSELLAPRSADDFVPLNRNLAVPLLSILDDSDAYNFALQHFGFQNRYAEYKVARDQVTGDFANSSSSSDNLAYINSRMFTFARFKSLPTDSEHTEGSYEYSLNPLIHSFDFIKDDGNQYLRLYYNDRNLQDYILFVHNFKVSFTAPMAKLFDSFEFSNQDYGKPIDINSQGSKV